MAEEPEKPPAADPPEPSAEPVPPPEPEPDWATRYRYLLADFDNFRKRAERERETVRLAARGDLLRSVLPVFEATERAVIAVAVLPPADPVRKGIELLAASWHAFLDAERVASVARPRGRFDPATQEAVGEALTDDPAVAGTIVEIVQQGYRIGHALLRPAKVVVARGPPNPGAESAAADAAVGEGE